MPAQLVRFITSDLGGFLSAILLGLILEMLFPLQGRRLPFKELRFGITYCVLNQFLLQGVAPLYGLVSVLITSRLIAWKLITLPSAGAWFFLSMAIYFVASDFLEYWWHRANHSSPFLWKIHSFHHSEEAFNVFTTWRLWFFAGGPLGGLLIYMLLSLMLRPTAGMVTGVAILHFLSNTLSHLNSRIEFGPMSLWFMNPQFHRIHHSTEPQHIDKNFASTLPIWDIVFGTAWKPRRGEFPSTGLVSNPVRESLINAFVWPVKYQ